MLYSYDKQAAKIDHYKEIYFDKGIDQGIKRDKIETAKKLYESNVSMDIIETATGFSEKQIRNICL